jgi:hypothetical protein
MSVSEAARYPRSGDVRGNSNAKPIFRSTARSRRLIGLKQQVSGKLLSPQHG